MTPKPPYVVYAADSAGNDWTVGEYMEALTALWVLSVQQRVYPDRVFGIYEKDEPVNGDIQLDLEEMLENDSDFLSIIRAAIAIERSQR